MNKDKQKLSAAPELNPSAIPSRAAGNLRESAAEPQTPLESGGNPLGAPPSNTAPSNPEDGHSVHLLRSAVDSLYLSYHGALHPKMSASLRELKDRAQSNNPTEVVYAQLDIADHVFTVSDRGRRGFAYNLSDNWFRLDVAGGVKESKSRPFVYAQISSELLTRSGPASAEKDLHSIVEALGSLSANNANVSRADLCVDFTTTYPVGSITDDDWISRVRYIGRHLVKRKFSGWSFGRGGDVVARLYDKTLEMEGKPRDYLEDEWMKAGWKPGQTVWRLEFQFRRPAMMELGVANFLQLMTSLGSLWAYGTESWLRLPDLDHPSTQNGPPVHPLWLALAAADWGTPREYTRTPPPKNRVPPDHWLYRLSDFTSYMARMDLMEPVAAWSAYWDAARFFHESRVQYTGIDFHGYLVERAMHKARLYNTVLNQPAANDDTPPDPVESPEARAYRKARDGE